MTAQHTADEHRRRTIGEIAALLDLAYEQTCAGSQFDPTRVDLGLGICLARAQACDSLDPGRPVSQSERSGQTSVPSLLRTAEQLTRDLPLGTDTFSDGARLVVGLCDLIRDADRVAW